MANPAKLLAEEMLSVEGLPHQRFRRWHIHVYSVDPGACEFPTSGGDILLHGGPGFRVILLEPHVVNSAFVVEVVIGILLQAFEVLKKSVRHKLANRVLHGPVPLRVEMRCAHDIQHRLRAAGLLALPGKKAQAEDDECQHEPPVRKAEQDAPQRGDC